MLTTTPPPLTSEQLNLFNQWYYLPNKVIKCLWSNKEVRTNHEDYLQIGRLALLQCVRGFVPNDNNTFKTYAYRGILNKMLCFLPKDRVITIPTSLRQCPVYKDIAEKSGNCLQLSVSNSDTLDKESNPDKKEMALHILSGLSERDRTILTEKFINGKTLKQAGQMFGVSRERIRQIIQRLKDRLVQKYWKKVA